MITISMNIFFMITMVIMNANLLMIIIKTKDIKKKVTMIVKILIEKIIMIMIIQMKIHSMIETITLTMIQTWIIKERKV